MDTITTKKTILENIQTTMVKDYYTGKQFELIKEIPQKWFEHCEKVAQNKIYSVIKYLTSEQFNPYYTSSHQIENIFGLPYTSSSDFAGFWNTNTQARPRYQRDKNTLENFDGVAYDNNLNCILIFTVVTSDTLEEVGTSYYNETGNNAEFLGIQSELAKIAGFETNKKQIETIKAILQNAELENILQSYQNKRIGEKTAERLNQDLKKFNCKYFISCQKIIFDLSTYKSIDIYTATTDNAGKVSFIKQDFYLQLDPTHKNLLTASKLYKQLLKDYEKAKKTLEELRKVENKIFLNNDSNIYLSCLLRDTFEDSHLLTNTELLKGGK